MTTPPHRVTYLIDGLNVGGAQVGMARLINQLNPDRFDITVVGLDGRGKGVVSLLPEHVTIIDLGIQQKYRFDRLTPLWRCLGQTDILVTSLFHSLVIGSILGNLRSVPNILAWQNSAGHTSSLRRKISRLAFGWCDHILADSEAVASMLREVGVAASNISVVPIAGVDVETYQPNTARSSDDGAIRVGSIGQLIPAKNYEGLIECAAQLDDTFEFHVVGDGPRRDALETLAAERTPDRVTFHGKMPPDEIPSFLGELDIYFQPSRREGLCITVIEAMACGLPVVGSMAGGISESVEHGQTGLLAPTDAIDDHCQHLRILTNDEELRHRYGRAARERVASNYSAEALEANFLEAISHVTGPPST
ncbi:glycosyltransferase family 4 protein [Natrialba sp. PRR66]|uniref:glycosyltransferase family 4 protein n=1 Tax=Natrialba sp. PRR66 TaxID=3098146 RepID=UPI002B1DAB71|nr:glycosyltransferase family 4 protein [Natrialba sp. PRR66]